MTTVVYRDGVLAADRRITHGRYIDSDACNKLFRTPDGWIGAFCGGAAAGNAFGMWALGDRDKPAPKGNYTGILVSPKRTVYEFECGLPLGPLPKPRKNFFYAWGSGGPSALGALHAGADAKKAVLIAQKVDSGSGGGADILTI